MTSLVTNGVVEVAAAWRGEQLRSSEDWIDWWRPSEVDAFDAMLTRYPSIEIGDLPELGPDDLSLPELAERFEAWRTDLFDGRGVVLVRGLPAERWSTNEAALVYWAIGQGLGLPIVQNPAGDVLGHVTDTGRKNEDREVRLYQTADRIKFHVDGSAVVGLLCLRSAQKGGVSRIASSVTIHNEVWARRPDLIGELFGRFPVDRRNEEGPGEDPFWMIPMARWDGERLRTFYHADYMDSSQRHAATPRFTPDQTRLLELIDEITADTSIHLDMDLEPGDIQLINNEVTVHARTAYVDHPGQHRHLLRLWLDARPKGNRSGCDATTFGSLFRS